MKRSNAITLACVIIAISAISLSIITLGNIDRHDSNGYADSHSSDLPYVQGITESNGYYNISLAFSNVEDPIRLDNILINPNSQENVTGLTIYANGTAVNTYPISQINSGDSLQVNLTLPITEYASGTTLYLYVIGDCIGCGKAVVLP